MDSFFSQYTDYFDEVFDENPITTLENYLGEDIFISAGTILQWSVRLGKIWDEYKKQDIKLLVEITDKKENDDIDANIFKLTFNTIIQKIKQEGEYKSCIISIDREGIVVGQNYTKESIQIEKAILYSENKKNIVFLLGIKGIDIIVRGKLFSSENYPSSYRDLMDERKRLGVERYRELISNFIAREVQFDPRCCYFVRRSEIPKQYQADTIDKYPKLLRNRPEEIFQQNFYLYLHDYCTDSIYKEVHNSQDDRYDIQIISSNDDLYIFELKWLGCSITENGTVNKNYNTEKRAIAGAYQILDYIEHSEKYAELSADNKIFCGILLVFDAREKEEKINFPSKFDNYPNIDLSQIHFIQKDKINASSSYKVKSKKAK